VANCDRPRPRTSVRRNTGNIARYIIVENIVRSKQTEGCHINAAASAAGAAASSVDKAQLNVTSRAQGDAPAVSV